ncbi:MAG TPA: NADH-quinone oxidoreductase subunit N [Armatimonadota bacterium]|nr:NADH-quinone oxidoreductase subunit N [Armatimonadota bacterium]
MNTPGDVYLVILLPALLLVVMALVVILVEAFFPESFLGFPTRLATAGLALIGFLAAGVTAGANWGTPGLQVEDNSGMIILDHYTLFLTMIFCLGGVLTVLISIRYLEDTGAAVGEYYCLLLFATAGAYFMAAANHLIVVFLGLEVLSVAIYPLAGFLRRDRRSNEASLKYFLLGAFSSAFLLYGIALIYGATGLGRLQMAAAPGASGAVSGLARLMLALGPLRFDQIIGYVLTRGSYAPVFWAGVALLLVGFCFKAALSPFHMWTPDVYDGAPTPVTAYMSAVVKAAAFAPFFRFFLDVLGRRSGSPGSYEIYSHWAMIMMAVAILTMTWGNLAAVAEPSMKRMLAYSSVAHAGYITVALIAESSSALLFYLLVYTTMVIGSFACVSLLRRRSEGEALEISEWTGVGLRYPWFGAAMALFMFALAGFPPTAGFMGKFIVFRAALETGANAGHQNGYIVLVSIALINSFISIYYYLRVVIAMYRPAPADAEAVHLVRDRTAGAAILICVIGVILLGVYPQIAFGVLSTFRF